MKYSEIKTKTKDELNDLLIDLKKENYNLRFQKKMVNQKKLEELIKLKKILLK